MKEVYYKYGSIIAVVLIVYLSYLIIQPYILSIVSAALIAYLFYPIYSKIYKKTAKKNISAILTCFIVLLVLVVPMFYALNSLIGDIPSVYNFISSSLQNSDGLHAYFIDKINSELGLTLGLSQLIQTLSSNLLSYLQGIVTSLPDKFVNVMLSVFFLFYFFKDGAYILSKMVEYAPFSRIDTLILFRELKNMADAVIYGQLITAAIQAFLATLAYSVLGVNAPLFWGFLTFIFGIIPMIGPSIIYAPISIYLVGTSIVIGDSWGIAKGVFLLLFGILIISTVDNVIKPLVISDKVRMHPALVLLGVIGGLGLFGIIGILLGPLILVFLMTLINIYEMKEQMNNQIVHPNHQNQKKEGEI
jgi:predicted PurR-regulated permease PerM